MKKIFLFGVIPLLALVSLFTFGAIRLIHAQSSSAACPDGVSCGSGTVTVSGLSNLGADGGSVTVTVNGTDAGDPANPVPVSQTGTINFLGPNQAPVTITRGSGADCSIGANPTASFNVSNTNPNPGDNVAYVWSSTCATSWSSTFSSPSCGTGPWNANTSDGSEVDTISQAQAGCSYVITYSVFRAGSRGIPAKSASKSVTVTIKKPTVYYWDSSNWGACTGGTETRTVTCKTGNTVVDNSLCSAITPVPDKTKECTASGNNWSATSWSTCSEGYQYRTVTCQSSSGTPLGPFACADAGTAPEYYQTCSPPIVVTDPTIAQCGAAASYNMTTPPGSGDLLCAGGYGRFGSIISNSNGTYTWYCSGAGSQFATCTSQPPSTDCEITSVTANPPAVFNGGMSTLSYSLKNCDVVQIQADDQQDNYGGPMYLDICGGSDNLAPNGYCYTGSSATSVQVPAGNYTVRASGLNNGAPPVDLTIGAVGLYLDVSPTTITASPGDTVKFNLSIPLGQTRTDSFGRTYNVPASFPPSLSGAFNPSSSLLAPSNISFSPATLTSNNNYTSVMTVRIPANTATGVYNSQAGIVYNGSGVGTSQPISLNVVNGSNPCVNCGNGTLFTLTAVKTIGGSIVSNDSTISCGITCSYSYTSGTIVTLNALPDSAYWKFIGWSGDCTGTTPICSVTMSQARNVSAKFAPKPLQYNEF